MFRFESRHWAGTTLPLHRHAESYAAVVLDGEYLEGSVDGLFRCEPGFVVVHPPFHNHTNVFRDSAVRVLNLRMPAGVTNSARVLRLPRLSGRALSRLNTDDLLAALREGTPVVPQSPSPLAQRAAAVLDVRLAGSIGSLSRELGVCREHLAREFRRTFGIAPSAYRAERRLQYAVRRIRNDRTSLSRVAHESGFSDHAHLTRTIRAALGVSPRTLRSPAAEVTGVQAGCSRQH